MQHEVVFPKWKPMRSTLKALESNNKAKRQRALRISSRNFISRKDVREYIFSRDGYKCCICGSKNNLQIDHIVSIYKYAANKLDYSHINDESNLQVLCRHCNSSKKPEL